MRIPAPISSLCSKSSKNVAFSIVWSPGAPQEHLKKGQETPTMVRAWLFGALNPTGTPQKSTGDPPEVHQRSSGTPGPGSGGPPQSPKGWARPMVRAGTPAPEEFTPDFAAHLYIDIYIYISLSIPLSLYISISLSLLLYFVCLSFM